MSLKVGTFTGLNEMHGDGHLCLTRSWIAIGGFYLSAESDAGTNAFPQEDRIASQKPCRGLWTWSKAFCSWEDPWSELVFSWTVQILL